MKKVVLTIAIVLGLGMASFAQNGLFGRGEVDEYGMRDITLPSLPNHGASTNQDAPLGGGALLLLGLGAAYAMTKKSKK